MVTEIHYFPENKYNNINFGKDLGRSPVGLYVLIEIFLFYLMTQSLYFGTNNFCLHILSLGLDLRLGRALFD